MSDPAGLSKVVFDRLTSVWDEGDVPFYDGVAPKGPGQRYGVFYPNAGVLASDRHGGGLGAFTWGFFVICVGLTPGDALLVAGTARNLLSGWRPDPGESAGPLQEVDLGSPLQREDAERTGTRFTLTLRWTLDTKYSTDALGGPGYESSVYGP